MMDLKDVTLVTIDTCGDYKSKNNIRMATISRIIPHLLNHIEFGNTLFINPFNSNSTMIGETFGDEFSWYNNFVLRKLPYLIKTKFYMIIQWDGFPINFDNWDTSFLNYEYIGGGHTLQNGGFSLRNTEAMIRILESTDHIDAGNEDHYISHFLNNDKYETSFKIKSGDEFLANRFSYFFPITDVHQSFGWHRNDFMSEGDIHGIFKRSSLFNDDEVNLLKMYSMTKSIDNKLFKNDYMQFFNMNYNEEFFSL